MTECFRIDSGARQGYTMSPRLFNVYIDVVMKEVKMKMGRRGVGFHQDCLKKKGLDVRQTRRMVHDRNAWRGFVRENSWGIAPGTSLDLDKMRQLQETR